MKKIISVIIPIFLVGCSITWIRPMEVEHNHNFKSTDKLVKKLESCLAHAGYEITVVTP